MSSRATPPVSPRPVLRPFKNKEDLFDALFVRIFDVVSNQLEADIRNAADMLQSLR